MVTLLALAALAQCHQELLGIEAFSRVCPVGQPARSFDSSRNLGGITF